LNRFLDHARRQFVAYLALFLSLGGTSVAAVGLTNHSIDPIKLDPKNIGGYVREWASVSANGHVVASGGSLTVRAELNVFPGRYYFRWHTKLTSPCTAIGSVDTGNAGSGGYLTAGLAAPPKAQPTSIVDTYNPQGQPTSQAFEVELLCSTPR